MIRNILALAVSLGASSAAVSMAQAGTPAAPDLFSMPFAKASAAAMPAHVRNMLSDDSVVWATSIGIDAGLLAKSSPQITLNLPQGGNLRVSLARSYWLEDGSFVWSGASRLTPDGRLLTQNEVPSTALFVLRGNRVTGQITTQAGEVFELLTSEDGQQRFMVKRDPSKLPEADDTPLRVDTPAQTSRGAVPEATLRATPRVDVIIRVLQVYTPQATTELGGQNAARDRANFFIAQSNTAFTNNALAVRFESAGIVFSSQAQPSNDGPTLVNRLSALADGYVDTEANATRNSTAADLVALVTNSALTSTSGGLCGIARAIGATATSGFFVQNQSCTTFTFVHEAAHLFGARHDNDPTTTPFSFGHGFVNAGGNFRTIMAVSSNPQPRLGYFSTTDQTLFANGATRSLGNANFANNERVMRERAPTMAAFR
jgi:peptidyl-Asp metalloendopeptidase